MSNTMHSFERDGWVIQYNGDYSGDVELHSPGTPTQVCVVPFDVLKSFMAEYFRDRIVSALERMDGNELLDRLTDG